MHLMLFYLLISSRLKEFIKLFLAQAAVLGGGDTTMSEGL